MKTILHFLWNRLAILLLFVIWLTVAIPNLKIYWMLVDDGADVVISRTLFEKLSSFNLLGFISQLLEGGGRFRPVYWIYQMTVWLIGGNNYQFHHFAHMLVIGLTVLFIYLIISEITKSKLISFFGALAFLLSPINTENIFRLGPQEPLLTLLLSILFYLLIKNKKIFLSCFVLILSVFTKETSVALTPVLFFYYFYGRNCRFIKNKKQIFYICITICASAILMILITFLRRSGYSTNYFFDGTIIIDNLFLYLKDLSINTRFVFPLFFVIYLLRNFVNLVKKQLVLRTKYDFFEFTFFLGFICFLLVQLPWQYAIDRYLMPAALFLIIFLFLEIYRDMVLLGEINLVKRNRRILVFISTVVGISICFFWGLQLVSREMASISYYEAFKKMTSFPKGTTLLMNMQMGEGTMELVYEIQIQLSEFWNRSDMKVEYLDLGNLPKNNYVIIDSGNFPRAYTFDKLAFKCNKNSVNIRSVTRNIVITTPLELVKQSAKKLVNLLLYKKEFTSEGLYTYSYNFNNWLFCSR